LAHALRKDFVLLLSNPILLEYEDVLTRPQHRSFLLADLGEIDSFLRALLNVGEQLQLGPFRRPTTIDPGDEHVVNLAWRGRADAIVTLNPRHFAVPASQLDINCLSPGDALRLLEDKDANQ
jgi:predicted nucleic acid-binding protein